MQNGSKQGVPSLTSVGAFYGSSAHVSEKFAIIGGPSGDPLANVSESVLISLGIAKGKENIANQFTCYNLEKELGT